MNNLDKQFQNLKMKIDPNDNEESISFDNHTNKIVSLEATTTTTNNSDDLVEVVNDVFIHMEVKNFLKKQASTDSNEMDDENELHNSLSSNEILRSYKEFLDANKQSNQTRLRNQYSVEEDDSMDTETFKNLNESKKNNKEILNEIKSLILNTKFNQNKNDHIYEDLENSLNIDHDDESLSDMDILPRNLIVTSIPLEVFTEFEIKLKFEKIFSDIDTKCTFCYFRLFKRCCIQYDDPISAVLARFELDSIIFLNEQLKIFLTKPIKLKNSRTFLEPPENDKAFLISPPSSPPVGWEQIPEDPPVINYELLAAISRLNPQEPCEIIKSQDHIPGIVIHPCADLFDSPSDNYNQKRKFIQTRWPANDIN